jgi:alpha-L-arabinofuranosidase
MKKTIFFCLIIAFALSSFAPVSAQTENLIANPSFENADGQNPADWRSQRWGGSAVFSYADIGRTGNRSIMISSEQGADCGWRQVIRVKSWSRYKFTGWIKTDDVQSSSGRGALFNLHEIQSVHSQALKATNDWTQVEMEFETGARSAVQINCLFGGWGQATGKAWFDDLALLWLSTDTARLEEIENPSVSIDIAKTREPISKFIYAQFIEHLGRCIYGGIWAEMLEDRKFYFPITPNFRPYRGRGITERRLFPVVAASPWQIIGPDESVSMVKENSFVGDHTPLIQSGGGMQQHDLGLVKNKKYTGYIYLNPKTQTAQVTVSLTWGEGQNNLDAVSFTAASNRYQKYPFQFTAGADTTKGILKIKADKGACFVGTVSLMPADHNKGLRADVMQLLKELNAPLYRWPGGNFVSGYDWHDGIGDRDRRPPRKNPAWTGVEHNDFGFHEFIHFCRVLNSEPLVTVNTGFGDAYSAAAQLEYSNGSRDSYWGKKRAENGDPEPFGVKFWCVGNEMFGAWQLGYMRLEHYVQKHNWVVDKMRDVDSNIIEIASGNAGPWSEGLLKNCADHIDLIAEHFYCQERPDLLAHTAQIPDNIKRKVDFHRNLRQNLDTLKGKDIKIAMTEWNYWYGPHVFGELGTRYFLKDGLGIARGLHEYFRHSDIMFMANYAQTVNVIGCIKASKTHAAMETTGQVLKLYRNHFGQIPVEVSGKPGNLDVSAALTSDRKTLTIAVVNPTHQKYEISIKGKSENLPSQCTLYSISGPGELAFNEPGKPENVHLIQKTITHNSGKVQVDPLSVAIYSFDLN